MATQGPRSPGTVVDDATVGTLTWLDPGNAVSSNNSYSINAGGAGISHYLKATNFGFTIPTGATINGIEVSIERKASTSDANDNTTDETVKIVKADGTFGTTNKADTTTKWPTSDTTKTYGSSSDVWGETWTAANINDTDFGVALSVDQFETVNGTVPFVDHITITITYTEVSGPANLKTYNTNTKANIKTINTNPIANVKTLNTNA